jgi:hypothetical protein
VVTQWEGRTERCSLLHLLRKIEHPFDLMSFPSARS